MALSLKLAMLVACLAMPSVVAPPPAQPPAAQPAPAFDLAAWEANMELGPEVAGVGGGRIRQTVYLITFARVLQATMVANPNLKDPSGLSARTILNVVRNAIDNPLLGPGNGRPPNRQESPIQKMVVFRERHQDGSFHFHVGVLLTVALGFITAKRALLMRHGLLSHWSSTHSEWWSVVRYGYMPNPPKKPKAALDPAPLKWAKRGVPFDLHEDSQEPYNAKSWRTRHEKREVEAADEGKACKFSRMDLQSVILSKGLKTKEAVVTYASMHGSASMKAYVKQVQRKLQEHIDDAEEWIAAPAVFAAQSLSEWDILCRAAEEACPHGDQCIYAQAAKEFFRAHAASLSQNALAANLRGVIMSGPSKDVRVPFLIGTTNTGKSTLVESFDALFGEAAVFHLPAITDTKYALRNWLKA